jgi:hypothetical protein
MVSLYIPVCPGQFFFQLPDPAFQGLNFFSVFLLYIPVFFYPISLDWIEKPIVWAENKIVYIIGSFQSS